MTNTKHIQFKWHELRAVWRDSWLLLREFRGPLLLFILMLAGCGWLFYTWSQTSSEPAASWTEGIYDILTITFLNSAVNFPSDIKLQAFFFLMPILGIGILAQGLADFGVLFFNRRSRGREWEIAVASTFTNHIVLIGLGHLGFRVMKILHEMRQELVVITVDPDPNLAESARGLGIPIIEGDGTRESILDHACIRRARSIILCTQNDSLNLQMALKARSLKPDIEVVIRIFDDDFASSLQRQFGFRALSATGMAAPIFASSASNIDITAPITIEGEPNSLARLLVAKKSRLAKLTIGDIEDRFDVSVVYYCHEGKPDAHPSATIKVFAGDTIAILGEPGAIRKLANDNQG
jgi:voltage-gated potassium channel